VKPLTDNPKFIAVSSEIHQQFITACFYTSMSDVKRSNTAEADRRGHELATRLS